MSRLMPSLREHIIALALETHADATGAETLRFLLEAVVPVSRPLGLP